MTKWELDAKIDEVIDKNIEDIPYEGYEINKDGIREDIVEFIQSLSYSDLEKIQNMKK